MVDNTYNISFKGLALGEHTYQYKIDNTFFEDLDNSEIKQGELSVEVLLIKDVRMLTLQFRIQGIIKQICDRCLEEMDLQINIDETLLIKISNADVESEDDAIIYIKEEEHTINIKQFIYEFVVLAIPMRKVHETDSNETCNETMNELLKKHISEERTDPRWDALKNLNIN